MSTTDVRVRHDLLWRLQALELWAPTVGLRVQYKGGFGSVAHLVDGLMIAPHRRPDGSISFVEIEFLVRLLTGELGSDADVDRVAAKWLALGGQYPGSLFIGARRTLALAW